MICVPLVLLFDYDVDANGGGLVPTGTLGQWGFAVPAVRPPGAGTGPVWSTRPSGNTLNDAQEFLTLTLPAVAGAQRPVLVIEHATLLGQGDTASFELDAGGGFLPITPIHGYPSGDSFQGDSQGYTRTGFELAGVAPGSRFRLRFTADAAGAGPGWFVRDVRIVDGDPIPPQLTILSAPSDDPDLQGPYLVELKIEEDYGIERAELFWSTGGPEVAVPLVQSGASWTASIPVQPPDTLVHWRVEVADCEGTSSVTGEAFRVFLPAPTDLSGPSQPHTVARSVTLDWEPPASSVPVAGYRVTELDSGATFNSTSTAVQVELDPAWAQRFQVQASYGGVFGDPSEVLELDVEVPELVSIEPRSIFPGDRVYLELEGRSLYLLAGASSLSIGETGTSALRVLDFAVADVDRARALVEVPVRAVAGSQDVVITGTYGSFRFADAFEVLDAADAPRITLVEPNRVTQGETVELLIHANRRFGDPVEITVDEDLVLGGTPVVEGDRIRVGLTALGSARAGEHTLVIDDGTRNWDVPIEVEEYVYQGRRGCDTRLGGRSGGLPGLAVLFASIIMRSRTRGSWRFLP